MRPVSIFDMPERKEDLTSTNQGLSRLYYDQIQALPNLTETDDDPRKFGQQGIIDFRWTYDSGSYWIPARSYIKFRIELKKNLAGDRLQLADDVAPAMGAASTLFSQIKYKINSTEISELSENIPQIDLLKKRLYNSGRWMNEVGASTNFYQSSFEDRQKQVCADVINEEPELTYKREVLTQVQLFPGLNVLDSITWTQVGNIITITDQSAGDLNTLIGVGDKVNFTINSLTKLCTILDKTGFANNTGTFVVDQDFGANQAIALITVALPNITLFKLRPPLLVASALNQAALFPNVAVAADTIEWIEDDRMIVIRDDPTADADSINLRSLFKVNDFISLTINGLTLISRVLSTSHLVQGSTPVATFRQKGIITIHIDQNFGADDAQAVFNAQNFLPIMLQGATRLNDNRDLNEFELIWQPPISIFNVQHAVPALGVNELEFTVESNNYKKFFVESKLADRIDVDNGGADYVLRIKSMFLHVCRVSGDRIDNKMFMLDLDEINCYRKTIEANNNTQISTTVKPSTNGIAIAYQDVNAGNDTRFSLTKFKFRNEEELTLTRYYIRYNGLQKPQPDFDNDDPNPNKDFIVEQYAKNQLYSGAWYDASQEKIKEWKERGIYLYHPWPKSAEDTSDRCIILSNFDTLSTVPQRLLVFNMYKKVAMIQIENAKVIDVKLVNA